MIWIDDLAIIFAVIPFGMLTLTSLAQWYGTICLLICLISVRKSSLAFPIQQNGLHLLNAYFGEVVALVDSAVWSYLLTFEKSSPFYTCAALTMICICLFQHMDITIHPDLQSNSGMPQLPDTLGEASKARYRRSRCHRNRQKTCPPQTSQGARELHQKIKQKAPICCCHICRSL